MTRSRECSVAGVAIWMLLTFHDAAEAYVDPGSGSMLMQLLLGALMGGLVVMRTWWHRVSSWVSRRPRGYAPEE